MSAAPPQWQDAAELDEKTRVSNRRYHEALDAGLSVTDANLFADSTADVGLLRLCVRNGWSAEMIAAVML